MQTDKPYVILGDSHVSAFLGGARDCGASTLILGGGWGAASVFYSPFFDIRDGDIIPSERTHYAKWKAVVGFDLNVLQHRLIVSLGLAAAPIYGSRTWRTFGFGRTPITDRLFETMIDDIQAETVRFYDALIERDLIAAVYAGPPPQREHPAFTFLTKAQVDEITQRYRRPVLERLANANIPVINLPIADDQGFLKPEFAADDPSHANQRIGPYAADALRDLRSQRVGANSAKLLL